VAFGDGHEGERSDLNQGAGAAETTGHRKLEELEGMPNIKDYEDRGRRDALRTAKRRNELNTLSVRRLPV
jgi:hypothetical protein